MFLGAPTAMRAFSSPLPAGLSHMTSRRRLFDPLPRFGAGEGGDPSRSDGEGEGYAAAALEMPSPDDRRCAPVATLSRSKARERGREPAALHLSSGRGKQGEPAASTIQHPDITL